MNRLNELYEVTKELDNLLSNKATINNRQEVIDKVNHLVEKRSSYLSNLTPPYTKEEEQIGEKLIIMNNRIQKELDILFESLKTEMKQVKQQKKSAHSYITPYNKLGATDGVYMDTKE